MALIGPVKSNGGVSGKRIKRDIGKHCYFFLCVFVSTWRRGGMDFIPPAELNPQHPSTYLLFFVPMIVSSFLYFFFICCTAPRPQRKIHHVITVILPAASLSLRQQRNDESLRSLLLYVGMTMVSEMVVTPSVMMSFPANGS